MFLVYESNLTVSSLAVGEQGLLKIVLKFLPILILLFLGNFIIIFFVLRNHYIVVIFSRFWYTLNDKKVYNKK